MNVCVDCGKDFLTEDQKKEGFKAITFNRGECGVEARQRIKQFKESVSQIRGLDD